jgi:hypothetical protein
MSECRPPPFQSRSSAWLFSFVLRGCQAGFHPLKNPSSAIDISFRMIELSRRSQPGYIIYVPQGASKMLGEPNNPEIFSSNIFW